MKKASIINLIKYHTQRHEAAFRTQAYEIAQELERTGDEQLGQYIRELLAGVNTFEVYAVAEDISFELLRKQDIHQEPLIVSKPIQTELRKIINATEAGIGVNKFLFCGASGTGKTAIAKQLVDLLKRDLYIVDLSTLLASDFAQTAQNVAKLFAEIKNRLIPERSVVLLDDIEALLLPRGAAQNARNLELVRDALVRGLKSLDPRAVLIATTNAYAALPQELVRGFDLSVDFDCYSQEDLIEIAMLILFYLLEQVPHAERNDRLLRKILALPKVLPNPQQLQQIMREAIAFSNQDSEWEYLQRIYAALVAQLQPLDLKLLQTQGFTVREIEILTGISKSKVARELKKLNNSAQQEAE